MRLLKLDKPKPKEIIASRFIWVRGRVDIVIDVREVRKLEEVLTKTKLHECMVFTGRYVKTDTPIVYISCKDSSDSDVMIKMPVEHHTKLLHLHWKLHNILLNIVVRCKLLKLRIKKLLRLHTK